MTDRKKILVVEDDPLISLDLEDELTDHGYDVSCAATVSKAQQIVAADRPALAILDMNLKSETTFALALALRDGGTPYFFLSGNDASSLPPELADSAILTKPVRMADLTKKVAALVREN